MKSIRLVILLGTSLLILCAAFFAPNFRKSEPAPKETDSDTQLVHTLLSENLSHRTFPFSTIAGATSGKKVIPLDDSESHQRVVTAIDAALSIILPELSRPETPIQSLSRINEASRFFEDALLEKLNANPELRCDVPPTKSGTRQRSGYPDLRITDIATGSVFYLDPKLVAGDSFDSTLRSFYFEPKDETLKITDDAVHLLVGIRHNAKPGKWRFDGWRLVDASKLRVRLKAEFQASNADLYRETELSLPEPPR
jgi:hypothetical protein